MPQDCLTRKLKSEWTTTEEHTLNESVDNQLDAAVTIY